MFLRPPPSSGGVALCELLNILENFPLKQFGYHTATSVSYITEAMRYTFADRNNTLGDPDFVKNPVDELISKDYAKRLSQKIQNDLRNKFTVNTFYHETGNTTHYSVVDKQGNAVSVTYTLNRYFGAGVIAGDTGFFLNDEMDDFTTQPGEANNALLVQGYTNIIQPGKRPLSSATPSIIFKDDHLFMVIGTPGGPRIITTLLLSLLNVIDYDMSLQNAIDAPRFHYQGQPDIIDNEAFAFTFITQLQLALMGYHLGPKSVWSAVEAIQIDPKNGKLEGACDRRRPDGAAIKVD